jgi:molybdopterin-biosynthesis enzyme MoeA-like protein
MNAEILAIGSELLLGETIDTNSAYLAQQLAAIGINLFRKSLSHFSTPLFNFEF